MPKSFSFLGVLPRGVCLDFPLREKLNWRLNPFSGPIEELGTAPSGAYLAMTKEQMTFAFFRVSRWQLTYSLGPVNLSPTIVVTDSDTGATFYTIETEFSFSLVEVTRNMGDRLNISSNNAERLGCFNFFGLDNNALPTYFNTNTPSFSVTSSDINKAEGSPDFPSNYSRSASVGEITFNRTSVGQEVGNWEFDQGQVGNLYYALFIVGFTINISDEASDGLLFNESASIPPEPGQGFLGVSSGTLPRIAGRLTTHPLPNETVRSSTSHKLRFQFSSETDFIELPLYDVTADLSALTNTAFNLQGFSGITIKPKEYFSYDPQDGGGPFYNSTNGEQLRQF